MNIWSLLFNIGILDTDNINPFSILLNLSSVIIPSKYEPSFALNVTAFGKNNVGNPLVIVKWLID